jgi:hypothetical protein
MLTLVDCIDYSDLTTDEIEVIAAHEHVPFACAVQMACCLAQSEEGARRLCCLLKDAVCDAKACGRKDDLNLARRALNQFMRTHPGV